MEWMNQFSHNKVLNKLDVIGCLCLTLEKVEITEAHNVGRGLVEFDIPRAK